jgi:hypothetical protein
VAAFAARGGRKWCWRAAIGVRVAKERPGSEIKRPSFRACDWWQNSNFVVRLFCVERQARCLLSGFVRAGCVREIGDLVRFL